MLIKELSLSTANLSLQKEFYTLTLGLELLWENEECFSVITGLSQLTFSKSPTTPSLPAHFAFNIPHNQITSALVWLKDRTSILPAGEQIIANFDNWNARAIYFSDPDGNIVEFIARHNLRNASEGTFDKSSILNISEIGLVGHKVKPLHDQLLYELELSRWRGDAENFAAIGDEHGLFILVPEGRPWFPTQIKALPCGFSITFIHEGKTHTLHYSANSLSS